MNPTGHTEKRDSESKYDPNKDSSCIYVRSTRDTSNRLDDKVDIKLTKRNMILGSLPNKQNVLILVDSGATKTLISEQTIQQSAFLSRQKRIPINPLRFMVGNGDCLVSQSAIEFPINIQNHEFKITALIVNNAGGIDIILGTNSLREIGAKLDFHSQTLRFKARRVQLHTVRNYTVKPGESATLTLKAKIPSFIKSREVLIQVHKFLRPFTPRDMVVKLRKGHTNILIHNSTNKSLRIKSSKPIGHVNLRAFGDVNFPVTHVSIGEEVTTLYRDSADMNQVYVTREAEAVPPQASDKLQTARAAENSTFEPQTKGEKLREENLKKHPYLDPNDPRLEMTNEEIIKRDIKLENCALSAENKTQLEHILNKNATAFSLHGEIGDCANYEVDFELTDRSPFYIRPYFISQTQKEHVDREVKKLVQLGVLSPERSAYTSPLMLVKNRNSGKYRVVADLRYLNNRVEKQNFPFPLIKEAIQILGGSGATILSTIDLSKAYFALHLSKKSRKYTGVADYFAGRTYVHNRLPMGLNISAPIWQSYFADLLDKNIENAREFCFPIMDDVIIFSRNETDHLKHLQTIFNILIQNGLKASPEKCQLARKLLTYMGHNLIVQDGELYIAPLKDRTEAIKKLQPPKNVREVRRFCGMVQWLSAWVPQLQTLLHPIHQLTKRNTTFAWSQVHEQNFEKIKELITSPPLLSMPSKYGKYVIFCDTSCIATGSSLWQVRDDRMYLIGYSSKSLPEACKRYSPTELELHGILVNLGIWKYLLKPSHFNVYTDHSAIVHIMKAKTEPPTQRISRILERLSEYSFSIGYKKGKSMVICDLLSRHPMADDSPNEEALPIAFSMQLSEDKNIVLSQIEYIAHDEGETISELAFPAVAAGDRPVTRAYAKAHNITVPSLTPSKETGGGSEVAKATEAGHADLVGERPARSSTERSVAQRSTGVRPVSGSLLNPIASNKAARDSLVNRNLQSVVRNIPIQKEETIVRSHELPGEDLLRQNKKLFDDIDDNSIVTRNVPRQEVMDRFLNQIKEKCLRDYHLPYERRELSKMQQRDPYFGPIYDFIASGITPSNRNATKRIINLAENFVLVEQVLFRLLTDRNTDEVKLTLCVPEELLPAILHLHHSSLLSGHLGIQRSYATLRKLYYIPHLYEKVLMYIRTCTVCQERKVPKDQSIPLVPRIPGNYTPFSYISFDLKFMPPSNRGHKYILVVVCVITRYVIAVPLYSSEACAIAEALLEHVIFCFGPPKQIEHDADPAICSRIFSYIWDALKVKKSIVSVGNHGSLVAERFIRTISDILIAQIRNKGGAWDKYIRCACFAHNTCASHALGGYSPFNLVYSRENPDLLSLDLPNTTDMTTSYKEYADTLKARFHLASKTIMEIQTRNQLSQESRSKLQSKSDPGSKYRVGSLVYLLCPTSSALRMPSKKIMLSYCGPFQVVAQYDANHLQLATLQGEILAKIVHVRRIKPAFIRTNLGPVSSIERLKLAMRSKGDTAMPSKITVVDESGEICDSPVVERLQYCGETDPVSLGVFESSAEENEGLAVTEKLSQKVVKKMLQQVIKAPRSGEYMAVRGRYKNGVFELLCRCVEKPKLSVWFSSDEFPKMVCTKEIIRTTGSVQKLLHRIYS